MSKCPHFDLANPEAYIGGPPFDWFAQLRREQPISWQEDPRFDVGYWAITKRKHLDFISKAPEIFSSAERSSFYAELDESTTELLRTFIINMDPPGHIKYRGIVRNAFTPRAVDSYEPRFREIARSIIDRVIERGQCEFVEEIAAELPMIAICELMGIPQEDRRQFYEWTNIMVSADDPELGITEDERIAANFNLFSYGQKLADLHREAPRSGITKSLLEGVVKGEHLTDIEFCNFFLLLVVAGNETTRTVISHGMRLLMEHPEQYVKLQNDPALIEHAIEEFLRYNSAFIQMRRTAMRDIEIDGVQMKKGDKVVLFYPSANHDEDVFPEPWKFDIERDRKSSIKHEHRAFGVGEHFCLGSHLARLELRVMFEEIVSRMKNPRISAPPQWSRSYLVNGIRSMPIEFDAA